MVVNFTEPRSKSTQAFIDANPDKFRIVTPEETAKTLNTTERWLF